MYKKTTRTFEHRWEAWRVLVVPRYEDSSKLLRPHPVILRRQPGMLLEEGAEGWGIRETEITGNLLNRLVRILHQINAATDYRLENQLLLEHVMSAKRMKRYLEAMNNDTKKAMALYRYNLKMSKLFVLFCSIQRTKWGKAASPNSGAYSKPS